MQGARDFASDLETFTGQSLLASVMLGSMTGLSICLLLMRRLVYRFRSAVMNVRRGHPDGHRFLDMIKQRRMSFVTIPKLVGLALFSWLYTFIIVSTIGKAHESIPCPPFRQLLLHPYTLHDLFLRSHVVDILPFVALALASRVIFLVSS